VLASEGVRHSLQVIFGLLVQSGATVAIPIDVYPVYWQIANRARLSVVGFKTFPKFDLSRILDAAQEAYAHYVLLPFPLKLHGRAWTNEEVATAMAWLCADKQRRLILDSVYSFGAQLDSNSKRLIESDQVVFLDSLSKAWLNEQVFGVAVIPEQDMEFYTAAFHNLAPAQAKLLVAHQLLERYPDLPRQVARELDSLRATLMSRVLPAQREPLPPEQGYLVAINCSVESLLKEHSLLAIPASAFGSRRGDWSVASALPVADASS
jgi:aspartate/methionine/tyrosine aminotransferase